MMRTTGRRWQLSELLDLEHELELDRRNGASSAAVADAQGGPGELLYAWMSARRDPEIASVGERFQSGESLLLWIGLALAALSGVGLTAGLLRYSGDALINVMVFLAVAVGVQLLALLVAVLALGLNHLRPRAGEWLLRMTRVDLFARQLALSFPLIRLRAFGLLQLWGVALNLGILATLLFKVVFFDLSFGWATTLDVNASQIQSLLSALSLPWRGALPGAVPTLEEVEMSRILLAEGTAGTGAASWWKFLFAAVLVYGFLPRLLLWLLAIVLVRIGLSTLKFETAACRSLLLRLRQPTDSDQGRNGRKAATVPAPTSSEVPRGGHYQLQLPQGWTSLANAGQLPTGFGVEVSDSSDGARLLRLVEAWRPPLEQDLAELREQLKAMPRDGVLLLGMTGLADEEILTAPDGQDLAIWSEFVRRRVVDPRIAVVPFQEVA